MNINELETDLDLIYKKLIEVNEKIYVYRYLFTDKHNVDLLNKFNYGIFNIFKETLYNDFLSAIFRVTDNANFKGDNNISIKFMVQKYKLSKNINNKVNSDISKIRKKIEPYRHKILMHNDYKEVKSNRLPDLIQMEDILKLTLLLNEIIIEIYMEYFNRSISFIPTNVNPDLFVNHLSKFKIMKIV